MKQSTAVTASRVAALALAAGGLTAGACRQNAALTARRSGGSGLSPSAVPSRGPVQMSHVRCRRPSRRSPEPAPPVVHPGELRGAPPIVERPANEPSRRGGGGRAPDRPSSRCAPQAASLPAAGPGLLWGPHHLSIMALPTPESVRHRSVAVIFRDGMIHRALAALLIRC